MRHLIRFCLQYPIKGLMVILHILLTMTSVGKWWISKPLWWLYEWLCSRYMRRSGKE